MRKQMIGGLAITMLLVLVGCQKVEANPYELKKEVRKSLTPKEQEAFISMYQSLEYLVSYLNDASKSYEEDISLMKQLYEQAPEIGQRSDEEMPIDLCYQYLIMTMDGVMGCQNYSNYADCKDAIDKVGASLSGLFTQTYDRRYSILIDEERFYTLYTLGNENKGCA